MNTTATPTATNEAPAQAPAVTPEAPKVTKVQHKVKAKAPQPTKESVQATVKAILSKLDKGQTVGEQCAIVEDAHRTLYGFAPDVEFSSNPEQKKAQRNALREMRGALGFAQANLLIVNALQNVKGAETVVKYAVRTLANGQVAGTETQVTKTPKRSGRSGIRT